MVTEALKQPHQLTMVSVDSLGWLCFSGIAPSSNALSSVSYPNMEDLHWSDWQIMSCWGYTSLLIFLLNVAFQSDLILTF